MRVKNPKIRKAVQLSSRPTVLHWKLQYTVDSLDYGVCSFRKDTAFACPPQSFFLSREPRPYPCLSEVLSSDSEPGLDLAVANEISLCTSAAANSYGVVNGSTDSERLAASCWEYLTSGRNIRFQSIVDSGALQDRSHLFLPRGPGEVKQRTYLSEAKRQLSQLSNALGFDESAEREVEKGLALAMRPWGNKIIPDFPFGWYSDISTDHSPIEYSVAIEHTTGKVQLRFLIEAQAEENTLAAFQQSALRLNDDIQKEYGQTVSLERFHLISDLFFPSSDEVQEATTHSFCVTKSKELEWKEAQEATTPQGPTIYPFAAYHSFCVTKSKELEWKLYLNPQARGEKNAANLIRVAFERLGMADSYSLLESILAPTDSFCFFALDLHAGDHARVKIYVQQDNPDVAAIAKKLAICPHTPKEEIERFCATMGGSTGPYSSSPPVIVYFAFKSNAPLSPEVAVHFPVSEYAPNDAEIKQRIEAYLAPVSSTSLATYHSIVAALQERPLEQGRGFHSFVGFKNSARGLLNTFYVSAEFFGVLSPIP
ncbi:hypothetical protein R1sor_001882 [Riccia sorocarpa]|uniref:Uncharacterized protein n=1 Tax=Riccia sorocarpa TaxID=122646 RepID=A0ABD3H0K9_9MARC